VSSRTWPEASLAPPDSRCTSTQPRSTTELGPGAPRRLPNWRKCAQYCPMTLVKTADLDPDKAYLFGFHPARGHLHLRLLHVRHRGAGLLADLPRRAPPRPGLSPACDAACRRRRAGAWRVLLSNSQRGSRHHAAHADARAELLRAVHARVPAVPRHLQLRAPDVRQPAVQVRTRPPLMPLVSRTWCGGRVRRGCTLSCGRTRS
jgi:hypothetical protein